MRRTPRTAGTRARRRRPPPPAPPAPARRAPPGRGRSPVAPGTRRARRRPRSTPRRRPRPPGPREPLAPAPPLPGNRSGAGLLPLPSHSGAQPARDLVVDRPEPLGHLLTEDASLPLPPDQHRPLSRFDVGVRAEVDREVVHADRADHRAPLALHQHLAVVRQPAPPAVSVA